MDVSNAGIILDKDEKFTLIWSSLAFGIGTNVRGSTSTGETYPGILWKRHTHEQHLPEPHSHTDFGFRTYMQAVTVPEPAAFVCFCMSFATYWRKAILLVIDFGKFESHTLLPEREVARVMQASRRHTGTTHLAQCRSRPAFSGCT